MLEFIWIDTHRDIFESGRVGTYIQKKLRKGISKIILNLLITNHTIQRYGILETDNMLSRERTLEKRKYLSTL